MSIPSRSRTKSLAAHALELVCEQRRRRGRDRASLALEGDLGDPAIVVELQENVLLVAAERVRVLEVQVVFVEAAEVVGPLVVLEDLVAVEVVHPYNRS
jgi:hypothetical protein